MSNTCLINRDAGGSIRQSLQWLHWIAATLSLLVPGLIWAATLDGVSYVSLPGDRVQVKLQMSAPVTQDPLSFTIDNPARIALDFPGTQLNLAQKTTNIGVGAAQSVSAVEAG